MTVRKKLQKITLPIGRAARLSSEMDALRFDCCRMAEAICRRTTPDETELEECARLDDALADAHRTLKAAVARIIYSRLKRRSRVG